MGNQKTRTGLNWSKLLEREELLDDRGFPNLEAVMKLLSEEGSAFIADNYIDADVIEAALEKTHAASPNVQFDLDTLAISALDHIIVAPERKARVAEQVANFVRLQSKLFKSGSDEAKYYLPPGRKALNEGGVIRLTKEFIEQFRNKHVSKQNT